MITFVLLIAIGAILLFLIFYSMFLLEDNNPDFSKGLIFGLLIVILAVAEILIIVLTSIEPKPQAIDVYRGNTELEIHSINNIPQDTIVVWKINKQK